MFNVGIRFLYVNISLLKSISICSNFYCTNNERFSTASHMEDFSTLSDIEKEKIVRRNESEGMKGRVETNNNPREYTQGIIEMLSMKN